MPSESAMNLARRAYVAGCEAWQEPDAKGLNECIVEHLAAAIEAAELRGMERAAAICDGRAVNAFQGRVAWACAAAIRAAVKEPKP